MHVSAPCSLHLLGLETLSTRFLGDGNFILAFPLVYCQEMHMTLSC